MTRWQRAELWLPMALLILTALGATLLTQQWCVELSERERVAYGARPVWQAWFDSLSVTCGVGLLTYENYTYAGRWVLLGLGIAGAVLYLIAARLVLGRLWAEAGAALPSIATILRAFVALLAGSCAAGVVLALLSSRDLDAYHAGVGYAISAFASLGMPGDPLPGALGWPLAVISLVSAGGWVLWLWPWRDRRVIGGRSLVWVMVTYAAFLLVSAQLITWFELPRGARGPIDRAGRAAVQAEGFAAAAKQVCCAAGAGMPTGELELREAADGTKSVLAGVVLVGGLGSGVGGGVKWLVVWWALAGCWAWFLPARGRSLAPVTRRCQLAGQACLGAVTAHIVVVALGLLLIENHVAGRYNVAPSLGDALLAAASAVGGANLSSGLVETVTSANLSRGIRQDVDSYQYGMVWLMLAMWLGRVLPVIVLARVAAIRFDDRPPTHPPAI